MVENYVNSLSAHAIPKAMTLFEIQQATLADPKLQQLAKMVNTGNWENHTNREEDKAEFKSFSKIKGDFTVNSDKTLFPWNSNCDIDYTSKKSNDVAHEGHQGIVKIKKN